MGEPGAAEVQEKVQLESTYRTPLIEELLQNKLSPEIFGKSIRNHLGMKSIESNDPEWRKNRFQKYLEIPYKSVMGKLKKGDFDINAILQESTVDHTGHLVVFMTINANPAVMILNKNAESTFFPIYEDINSYLTEQLNKGEFRGCYHYATQGFKSAYQAALNNLPPTRDSATQLAKEMSMFSIFKDPNEKKSLFKFSENNSNPEAEEIRTKMKDFIVSMAGVIKPDNKNNKD